MAVTDLVEAYLAELPGESRWLADSEWGLTVPAHVAPAGRCT